MKRVLGFLMALMICLGVFTLVGGVNTVKAASSGTWGTAGYELDDNNNLVFTGSGTITRGWPTGVTRASIKSIRCADGVTVSLPGDSDNIFADCTSMVSFDASGFDVSNVHSMRYLFSDCKSLTTLDLTGWNTSRLTNAQYMFDGCRAKTFVLTSLNTSNVTNMQGMFMDTVCSELDLSNLDTRRVTNMNAMFSSCRSLNKIVLGENCTPLGNHLTDPIYMISLPTTSNNVYTNKWVREDGVYGPYTAGEFQENYTPAMAGTWVREIAENPYAVYDSTTQTLYFLSAKEIHENGSIGTVHSISGGEYTGTIYSVRNGMTWGSVKSQVKKVIFVDEIQPTGTSGWFKGFSNCTEMDLAKLNTSNVTEMSYMFEDCKKLVSLDLSRFDTSRVTGMQTMFDGCSALKSLNLSNWDTSKVSTMNYMFYGCKNLENLDVSHFNTSKVRYMHYMFYNCAKLKSLDLSNFDTSVVANMQGMLDACKFESVKLGENFSFKGNNNMTPSQQAALPTPSSQAPYTGKWIREDKAYGPYTPAELRDNYTSAMAGTWVWELAPVEYTISFEAGENGTGAMQSVNAPAKEDFTLPVNQFVAFGYEFDHWDDGNGHTYSDEATIPANTYAADTKVTLTAVWKKRDTSLNWDGNEAEFSIRAGEQAVLDNIPAGTSYQVYELTPDGWVLVQQENASGVIEALEESAAAFWNKYQPGVTTVQFSGLKNLDGRPAEEGKFTFELYEGETLVDTATTQDGGFIQFKVIEYDAAGDHVYTIREVDPNDDTIDYDTHEETVEVSVTDNGDGTLSSEVTYDDDGIVFSNTTRPGTLRITKDAMNGTTQNVNDEFTIEIEFRNESGMPINDDIYWYVEGGATIPAEISDSNQE